MTLLHPLNELSGFDLNTLFPEVNSDTCSGLSADSFYSVPFNSKLLSFFELFLALANVDSPVEAVGKVEAISFVREVFLPFLIFP